MMSDMLLRLRTKDERLIVKDMRDIACGLGFDMCVFKDGKENWRVRINKKYVLDKKFDSKEKAEKRMCEICDWWNKWEDEWMWGRII